MVDTRTGCWLWCRSVQSGGYGQVQWDGRNCLVHRLVYSLLVGGSPRHLHHRCHVRRCCNPGHLEPTTPSAHRAIHREESTHCHAGHEWTAANTYTRSNGERQCRACKAATMRRRYADGNQTYRSEQIKARTARRQRARASAR